MPAPIPEQRRRAKRRAIDRRDFDLLPRETQAALLRWRDDRPRTWKRDLDWAWRTGEYGVYDRRPDDVPLLESLRAYGEAWLTRLRIL